MISVSDSKWLEWKNCESALCKPCEGIFEKRPCQRTFTRKTKYGILCIMCFIERTKKETIDEI